MDLAPLLAEGFIPEPIADIVVSLPSESYQDFSFVASGESGLITTLLLLIVDNETPGKIGLHQQPNLTRCLFSLRRKFRVYLENLQL